MSGDVSVRRRDSSEYAAAAINAPLVANDSIATGPSGQAELQLDYANVLRVGRDTEVRLTNLELGRFGMQIARGTMAYRVLRDSSAQIEISTPTVSVRPVNRSAVRVSVLDNGQTEITVRSGQAEIFTPSGVEQLGAGQTMIARGSASDPEFQIVNAIPIDEWDNWNDSRDRALAGSRSYQYVSRDIYGAEDLDRNGSWINDPSYGEVWRPAVSAGWAPYRDGRWVWMDDYGWTWLGDEPWGWAPYHYGNWFYGSAGWCWYPGSIYSHSYWRPAVVGFFGFGRGSGGYGFGFGNVGWVPLAPSERYRPWYGRGFGGRSFNIASNTNVYSTFRNARAPNGVTGISAQRFAGGRVGRNFAVPGNQLSRAGLVSGGLPFRPGSQSLRFSDRQASFVPRGNAFSRPFSTGIGSRSRSQTLTQSPRNGGGFGQTGQSGRGFAGPSGRSRGNGGPATAPSQGAGNWSRFGQRGQGARSYATAPSTPAYRDYGGNGAGRMRGNNGPATAPSQGAGDWSRFGQRGQSARSYAAAPLANAPSQRAFSRAPSTPAYRDYGGSRSGSVRGNNGPVAAPSQDRGGSRHGSMRGNNGPAAAPSQRAFTSAPSAPVYRDRGASRNTFAGAPRNNSGFQGHSAPAAPPSPRSAPSANFNRGAANSAPRSGGGEPHRGGGSGRDKHAR